jgi:hypothetical protein
MQVGIITIRQLFQQDRRHVVPLYQRPYVWHRELQWEPLWEDLRTVAERLAEGRATRPHFLGAIVLENIPQRTGEVEVRLVIDGQQRLTTIQILMEAFHDFCGTIGADKHHRALVKLVRNDDPMSKAKVDVYKVWPTNVDRDHFVRIMELHNPNELRQAYGRPGTKELGHPILDAYLFFYNVIQDWALEIEGERDQRLDALIDAIRDHVRLVVIDVNNEDDAQVIFETLNARGTPLLPSDLVKNHLFHRAELEGESLDELYDQYWREFDEHKDYWRLEIGRGHAKRARVDLFLQNFLTLRIRDEIAVAHLYATFRDHSRQGTTGNARNQLATLRRYADIYQGFETFKEGSRQALFFDRLNAMELATTHPFLMELFSYHGTNAPEVVKVLEDLESFLVRRLVCQLNTRGYGRFFIDLLSTLDGATEGLRDRVRMVLLQTEAETGRWPSDEEFRQSWMDSPLYKTMLRSRLRMLLEALDAGLKSEYGENLVLKDKLTVEHLMPQQWREHWKLPEGMPEEVPRQRDQLLHTIGNLTLLREKLNSSISNGDWDKKLDRIRKHSRLNLNAELDQYGKVWNEDEIHERGERLFKVALRIWPKAS